MLTGIDGQRLETIHQSPSTPRPTRLWSACALCARCTSSARGPAVKITIPAVKIAGAPQQPSPLPSIESVCDDLLGAVPDSCLSLSLTEKRTMPFPEACPSLVASSAAAAPIVNATTSLMGATAPPVAASAVTTDESGEDSDLGEFLLDAVQWL